MAMDKERWPKICLREEMRGIMNGKATKWGKSMREGIEGSKNRGLCEAIWSGQEGDGVQKKIREELEEWWEQECKKEEEKIEKSTYNTIYKEITAGAVGNEYLNSKGVNMEDRVIWARMRCGNIGRAGKKGEKEWTCRLCGGEDETLWHLLECEEATREQEEETKKELCKCKGNKGKGEMQEMIIRELKGEINTIICRYMRKVEEKIKRERRKKEMEMEEEEEESERE
ncbi:hypothetical protein PV326_008572 [Microctonus aethiopoides]|nr:hypothetical protein PV326_008572 [Microctonus aethiopoides]